MSTHVTDLLALRHASLLYWTRSCLEGVYDHVWGNDTPQRSHLRTHCTPAITGMNFTFKPWFRTSSRQKCTNRAPQAPTCLHKIVRMFCVRKESARILITLDLHSQRFFFDFKEQRSRWNPILRLAVCIQFSPFLILFPSASCGISLKSLLDLDKVLRLLTSWLGIQMERCIGDLIMMEKCKSFSSVIFWQGGMAWDRC